MSPIAQQVLGMIKLLTLDDARELHTALQEWLLQQDTQPLPAPEPAREMSYEEFKASLKRRFGSASE